MGGYLALRCWAYVWADMAAVFCVEDDELTKAMRVDCYGRVGFDLGQEDDACLGWSKQTLQDKAMEEGSSFDLSIVVSG